MANFLKAIEWMKLGQKVKRNNDTIIYHSDKHSEYIYNEKGNLVTIPIYAIEANDWEVYEEEDVWNYIDEFNKIMNKPFSHSTRYSPLQLKLKEKIIEDLENEMGLQSISIFKSILTKRFGF